MGNFEDWFKYLCVFVCVSLSTNGREPFYAIEYNKKKANRSDMEIDKIIIELITIKHFVFAALLYTPLKNFL